MKLASINPTAKEGPTLFRFQAALVIIKSTGLGCKTEGFRFCLLHIAPVVCSLQSASLTGDKYLCHMACSSPPVMCVPQNDEQERSAFAS